MKEYKVIWEESHSAIVKANSKEEAEEKALNGEYEGEPQSEQLTAYPKAFEVEE